MRKVRDWQGRAILPGGYTSPACPAVNRRDLSRRVGWPSGRRITPAHVAIAVRKVYGVKLRSSPYRP